MGKCYSFKFYIFKHKRINGKIFIFKREDIAILYNSHRIIFKQISEYLETGKITYFPTDTEKIEEAIRHVKLVCEIKGENRGILEARKHIAWYIKGIPHSNELKTKVFTISNERKMLDVLEEALERLN